MILHFLQNRNISDYKIEVFPNPAQNYFTLDVSNNNINTKNTFFVLFSAKGEVVKQFQLTDLKPIKVFRDGLAAGVYFYKLLKDGEVVGSGKVTFQN